MKKLILMIATFLIFASCDTPEPQQSAKQEISQERPFKIHYKGENITWNNRELLNYIDTCAGLSSEEINIKLDSLTEDEEMVLQYMFERNPVNLLNKTSVKLGMTEKEVINKMGKGVTTMHTKNAYVDLKQIQWKNKDSRGSALITFDDGIATSLMFL